jgi:hypothetical protein
MLLQIAGLFKATRGVNFSQAAQHSIDTLRASEKRHTYLSNY